MVGLADTKFDGRIKFTLDSDVSPDLILSPLGKLRHAEAAEVSVYAVAREEGDLLARDKLFGILHSLKLCVLARGVGYDCATC